MAHGIPTPGATITDAAGVSRSLAVIHQPGWDDATRAILHRVLSTAGEQSRPTAASAVLPPVAAVFVLLFLLIGAIVILLPGPSGSVVAASLLLVCSVGLWLWTTRSGILRGRDWSQAVAAMWLEHRRCPSCAYPLSTELTGDQRGLWRCPECGGLWKPSNGTGR